MTILHLRGRITEGGELEVELPDGLPAGEARVTIETPPAESWTTEELARAVEIEPMSGAELAASGLLGGWSEQGISGAPSGWSSSG